MQYEYDTNFDKQLEDLLRQHPFTAGKILASKKMKMLHKYVMSCTQFCYGTNANLMTRMLFVINHCTQLPRCKTCGKTLKNCNAKNITLNDIRFEDAFKKYCSPRCEMTDNDVKDKQKKTNIERYGCECSFQNEEVKQKSKQTMNMKYGVDYAQQNKYIHAKSDEVRLKTLGYKNALQNANCKRKLKERTSRRFFENNLMKNKIVQPLFKLAEYVKFGKDTEHLYRWKCLQCGEEFDAKLWTSWFKQSGVRSYARCCHCYPEDMHKSAEEIDFLNAVKSLTTYKVIANARVLEDTSLDKRTFKEIDVYIPQLKLGFEYDGIWWHSVEMKSVENTHEEHYHLKKTVLAEKAGIKLVHIRSDIWKHNREKTVEMIKDMIDGNVNFLSMLSESGKLVLDRSIWNKCWKVDGFVLEEELSPQISEVKQGSNVYHYENCGILVFKKMISV